MSFVLRNQIEASERSAEELEQELSQESRRGVGSQDLRDLARSLVQLFRSVCTGVEASRKLTAGNVKGAINDANFALYQRLGASFGRVNDLIRQMERWGYPIDGKDDFAKAWRELRAIASFAPEEVERAAEQFSRGEVRPLGEVRDELRDPSVG